jgi:predicted double-glycine peptidase
MSFFLLAMLIGCCHAAYASSFIPEKLIRLPLTRQATDYTCGVAVVQSVLYYNGIEYRQDILEKELGATPDDGTSHIEMRSFLVNQGIGAEFEENLTLEKLIEYLRSDKPVICLIQAWNGQEDYDYSNSWEDGHYVVAVGFDDKAIYFMDPSTLGNYTYIPFDEFQTRWHDGDTGNMYYNAGIVITNSNPVFDPANILKLE